MYYIILYYLIFNILFNMYLIIYRNFTYSNFDRKNIVIKVTKSF